VAFELTEAGKTVQHYTNLIGSLRDNKVEPYVTGKADNSDCFVTKSLYRFWFYEGPYSGDTVPTGFGTSGGTETPPAIASYFTSLVAQIPTDYVIVRIGNGNEFTGKAHERYSKTGPTMYWNYSTGGDDKWAIKNP
jgi:hypothetical protein